MLYDLAVDVLFVSDSALNELLLYFNPDFNYAW